MANDVDVEPGRVIYGQWLNNSGGIEADLTVTRLTETVFLIVTSAASATRDLVWLKKNIPEGAHCIATDITGSEAVFSIMGPTARDIMQKISTADFSNTEFPFGTAREIEVGMALARRTELVMWEN